MATTAVLVEMVIIGCFAALWLVLAAVRVHLVDPVALMAVPNPQNWATPILFFGTAVIYQIGWVVNAVADALTAKLLSGRVRDKLFEQACLQYEPTRATVYQKASTALIGDIVLDRVVVRLARAGVLNFACLGLVLFSFWGKLAALSLCCFAFSILCGWQLVRRYRRYYLRIISASKVI